MIECASGAKRREGGRWEHGAAHVPPRALQRGAQGRVVVVQARRAPAGKHGAEADVRQRPQRRPGLRPGRPGPAAHGCIAPKAPIPTRPLAGAGAISTPSRAALSESKNEAPGHAGYGAGGAWAAPAAPPTGGSGHGRRSRVGTGPPGKVSGGPGEPGRGAGRLRAARAAVQGYSVRGAAVQSADGARGAGHAACQGRMRGPSARRPGPRGEGGGQGLPSAPGGRGRRTPCVLRVVGGAVVARRLPGGGRRTAASLRARLSRSRVRGTTTARRGRAERKEAPYSRRWTASAPPKLIARPSPECIPTDRSWLAYPYKSQAGRLGRIGSPCESQHRVRAHPRSPRGGLARASPPRRCQRRHPNDALSPAGRRHARPTQRSAAARARARQETTQSLRPVHSTRTHARTQASRQATHARTQGNTHTRGILAQTPSIAPVPAHHSAIRHRRSALSPHQHESPHAPCLRGLQPMA